MSNENQNSSSQSPFVIAPGSMLIKSRQRKWELQQLPMKAFCRPPYAYTSEEVITEGFDRVRR